MTTPITLHSPPTMNWNPVKVRGGPYLDEGVVFEGEYELRSAYFRMPAGSEIPDHTHAKWVQVLVVEGQLSVTHDSGTMVVEAGECYFNRRGARHHAERAVVDSLVLVTQEEDIEE